jgi:hypothetical protein
VETSTAPIFDLVRLEYPEISWEQGTVSLSTFQGGVIRVVAISPLRACFYGD